MTLLLSVIKDNDLLQKQARRGGRHLMPSSGGRACNPCAEQGKVSTLGFINDIFEIIKPCNHILFWTVSDLFF